MKQLEKAIQNESSSETMFKQRMLYEDMDEIRQMSSARLCGNNRKLQLINTKLTYVVRKLGFTNLRPFYYHFMPARVFAHL